MKKVVRLAIWMIVLALAWSYFSSPLLSKQAYVALFFIGGFAMLGFPTVSPLGGVAVGAGLALIRFGWAALWMLDGIYLIPVSRLAFCFLQVVAAVGGVTLTCVLLFICELQRTRKHVPC